eukprot:3589824-Pyramimonas_sp.AAC.1
MGDTFVLAARRGRLYCSDHTPPGSSSNGNTIVAAVEVVHKYSSAGALQLSYSSTVTVVVVMVVVAAVVEVAVVVVIVVVAVVVVA